MQELEQLKYPFRKNKFSTVNINVCKPYFNFIVNVNVYTVTLQFTIPIILYNKYRNVKLCLYEIPI